MPRLLFFLLLAVSLSSASPAPQDRVDLSWLNGTWTGEGFQPGNSSSWTIQLTCNTKEKKFNIQYPSLNCSGNWTIVKAEHNRVVFKEKITKNTQYCVPEGTLVVTKVDDKHISYSYFTNINGKQQLGAFSTLTKS